jgi:rubrerythrin
MGIRFNADEIYEMAEQIERNGAAFYRRSAECVSDPEFQKMFHELALMEDEHEKTFAAMRSDLTDQERQATVFDPDGEAPFYLRAIADGKVFTMKQDLCSRLTGKESVEEIVRMAIDFEKDSIVFYLDMKDVVPEKLGSERIDAIIAEERKHILILGRKLASL